MIARPAVFLDRDGTLIEDRGHLRDPRDVALFSETVPALLRLQPRFPLFIVTHQPGVAQGVLTLEDVRRVNDHVAARLREEGIVIQETYCCPHQRADGCACIKPKPLFLERAAREHGVELRRSFVVGDHPHDVRLAENVCATGVYVLTGHGRKHLAELGSDAAIVARHIGEAADIIDRRSDGAADAGAS